MGGILAKEPDVLILSGSLMWAEKFPGQQGIDSCKTNLPLRRCHLKLPDSRSRGQPVPLEPLHLFGLKRDFDAVEAI